MMLSTLFCAEIEEDEAGYTKCSPVRPATEPPRYVLGHRKAFREAAPIHVEIVFPDWCFSYSDPPPPRNEGGVFLK
jgi:hypothetical protein